MYRKVKNQTKQESNLNEPPKVTSKEETQQILTRSSVRKFKQNKKRNSWLNMAILIVVLLLGITIYAVLKL
ncbi:hypothetical protein CBF34_02190 [Vagococcus penaei]|uniref:Uncharacterized protein n=1 Tax=Vagococcus penaei TaxID=633807 RepID=A0A1Q2D805_9ENTE|nr:hypothetical protein [Vagococcus penaei]AQP54440.1 hypothetical protein BW732_09505 [Vagococcus penaei]RSU06357.1 hypothetical protein CBF34_02190 [Vagococcus penaei]